MHVVHVLVSQLFLAFGSQQLPVAGHQDDILHVTVFSFQISRKKFFVVWRCNFISLT